MKKKSFKTKAAQYIKLLSEFCTFLRCFSLVTTMLTSFDYQFNIFITELNFKALKITFNLYLFSTKTI